MSKGTQVRSVRINSDLWEQILRQVVSLKIWSPQPGKWTVSRFIEAACREKLAKMARSRNKQKPMEEGVQIDQFLKEMIDMNTSEQITPPGGELRQGWLCETCMQVWEDNLPVGTPACSYCGARARKLTIAEYIERAPLHFLPPRQ